MKITRYYNGQAVSQEELSTLCLQTPELIAAVNEVRRRSRRDNEAMLDGSQAIDIINTVGAVYRPVGAEARRGR